MQGTSFDNDMISGLSAMAEANWPEAQSVLATRLQNVDLLGNRRLNLFLLSVAAASGGHHEAGNQLWTQAQQAPITEDTSRYLDLQLTYNDPRQQMLLDLEKAWWNFNGWNKSLDLVTADEPSIQIDWNEVVHSTLQGHCRELETKYGRLFEETNSETTILWNFLALSYLQSGNVRTYEDMVSNSPPNVQPESVPNDLALILENEGLHSALDSLEKGHWLTNEVLFQGESAETAIIEAAYEVEEQEWIEQMQNGFCFIDLNQLLEASRVFQLMASRTDALAHRLLSLNALAFSFFKLGDYSQAETVYFEFKNLLDANPIDPGSDLAQKYRSWLASVDAAPEDGSTFFSPFGTKSDWNDTDVLQDEVDFWNTFGEALNLVGSSDFHAVKRHLQTLEGSLQQDQTNERYLVSLGFLITAVTEGDHFGVQEFEVEVENLRHHATFSGDELDSAKDSFRWAGFEILADKIQGDSGKPSSINPWQDVVRVETATDDFSSLEMTFE